MIHKEKTDLFPETVYYEPQALDYPLGQMLRRKYADRPWVEITSHNNIEVLRNSPNSAFPRLKRQLIIGVRKTHRYVPNQKISDCLVPYTSSGCGAMCLYCYLVCNYNKCAYLRLFVNREQMLERLIQTANAAGTPQTFEIGSNSDLVLENTITGNLPWTIEKFAAQARGFLTFPTKFEQVDDLLGLNHDGKTIFRMSVNPEDVIRRVEIGTSPLSGRIRALNEMCRAGYRIGILLAPVILLAGWEGLYRQLITRLADELCTEAKQRGFFEIIFMTYSYVHNAINTEAFPNAPRLYDPSCMTGRGRGKYCYRPQPRQEAEFFLRECLKSALPGMPIVYIV